jgi:plastocyanin
MKKGLLILFILSSFNSKGTIHKIGVWGGYYEFVPASITIQLGDTIEWEPYFGMLPTMLHTITSDNIPIGAVSFDQVWQMPADTFFQYIPQVVGLYQYVCTPHIPNGMIGEFTVNNGSNTQTYVPDDYFEQELINLGYDNILDDFVITSSIDTVTKLDIFNVFGIVDMTGIQDFTSLTYLNCSENDIVELDVSFNINLDTLICDFNNLTCLNISNGNNANMFLHIYNGGGGFNEFLSCIEVDDSVWANNNWNNGSISLAPLMNFSNNCNNSCSSIVSAVQEHTTNKELLKVTNLLGRETKQTNQLLFYIYDDGTVEKRINIE